MSKFLAYRTLPSGIEVILSDRSFQINEKSPIFTKLKELLRSGADSTEIQNLVASQHILQTDEAYFDLKIKGGNVYVNNVQLSEEAARYAIDFIMVNSYSKVINDALILASNKDLVAKLIFNKNVKVSNSNLVFFKELPADFSDQGVQLTRDTGLSVSVSKYDSSSLNLYKVLVHPSDVIEANDNVVKVCKLTVLEKVNKDTYTKENIAFEDGVSSNKDDIIDDNDITFVKDRQKIKAGLPLWPGKVLNPGDKAGIRVSTDKIEVIKLTSPDTKVDYRLSLRNDHTVVLSNTILKKLNKPEDYTYKIYTLRNKILVV